MTPLLIPFGFLVVFLLTGWGISLLLTSKTGLSELPEQVYFALVTGFGLQAIMGSIWGWVFPGYPLEQFMVWAGVTLGGSVWALSKKPGRFERSTFHFWVGGLVLLSIGLRLIDPLRHAALGQSDAYVHLGFIQFVLDHGRLPTLSYPPGFHWGCALPIRLFRMDPYEAARFGGAAFGAILSLGCYVAGYMIRGRKWDGIFALVISTFFPPWYLLTKTGIGLFANQAGLILALGCLIALWRQHKAQAAFLFLALVVTVPMMTLHLFPIMLVTLWVSVSGIPFRIRRALLWGGVALCLLSISALIMVLNGSEPATRMARQISMQWGENEGDHPLFILLGNYLTWKRTGLGNPVMTFAGLFFLTGNGYALVRCIRSGKPLQAGFWIWGVLAGISTLTGLFDFSAYQRSGWDFLISSAVGVGVVAGWCLDTWSSRWPFLHSMVPLGIGVLVVGSFLHPPGHHYMGGEEEENLIKFALWVSRQPDDASEYFGIAYSKERPLLVVTRQTTAFASELAEPVSVVAGQESVFVRTARPKHPISFLWDLPPAHRVVVIGPEPVSGRGEPKVVSSAFSAVSPDFASRYQVWQRAFRKQNKRLRRMIEFVENEGGTVRRLEEIEGLEIFLVDTGGKLHP